MRKNWSIDLDHFFDQTLYKTNELTNFICTYRHGKQDAITISNGITCRFYFAESTSRIGGSFTFNYNYLIITNVILFCLKSEMILKPT